jgi:hypothetical protein
MDNQGRDHYCRSGLLPDQAVLVGALPATPLAQDCGRCIVLVDASRYGCLLGTLRSILKNENRKGQKKTLCPSLLEVKFDGHGRFNLDRLTI